MARDTSSRWRRRSREVIRRVLAGLPPGATDKERRAAVSAAYPFGAREHHPYKMWLAEVKLALGVWSPPAAVTVRVRVGPAGVCCDWCIGKGCLACHALRERYEAERDATDWLAWCEWRGRCTDGDPLTRLAFADWLEERGWVTEAAAQRGLAGK